MSKWVKSSKIYDPFRKKWVVNSPEEKVRQELIYKLISLGFEENLIAIEKKLDNLPTFFSKASARRRADIICYANKIHPSYPLYPLLMIECKAVPITNKVIEQVTGYNYFVGAYFIAVANEKEVRLRWYNKNKESYESIDYIPSYQELISSIKSSE